MALQTNPGTTTLTLRLQGTGDVTIDWGDSSSDTYTLTGTWQNITHVYATAGVYTFDFTSGAANVTRWDTGSGNYGGVFPLLENLVYLYCAGSNTVSDVSALLELTFLFMAGSNTVPSVSVLTKLTFLNLQGQHTAFGFTPPVNLRYCRIDGLDRDSVDTLIQAAWAHRNTPPSSGTREYEMRYGGTQPPSDTMRSLADALVAGTLGTEDVILRTATPPAETDDTKPYNELVTIAPLVGFFPTGHAPSDAAIAVASTQLSAGPEPVYSSGSLTLNPDLTTTDATVFDSQSNGTITKTFTLQEFIASQWEEVAPEDEYVIGRDYRATVSAANNGGTDFAETQVSNVVTYAGPQAAASPSVRIPLMHELTHSLS